MHSTRTDPTNPAAEKPTNPTNPVNPAPEKPANPAPTRPRFSHHGLDAHRVALDALVLAHAMAGRFGRGYGPLADQLRRATQSVVVQIGEGAAKRGAERAQRFRGALGEANEAASAVEAAERLGVTASDKATELLVLLGRVCAMLTKLVRKM